MGDDHPNALAYRRTADAFRTGELDVLASLISKRVVWHVPGSHSMAGEIHGQDELFAWLTELRRRGFWLEELEVFANDRYVCAISLMGARREAIDVSTRVVSVFRYEAGQQMERWIYADDVNAWDQIFDA